MSINNIQQKQQKPIRIHGDFAYRFQLAESLPKGQKAVIFIGNTRAGKSTLCCASANVEMFIVYDKSQVTYINPLDQEYQSYVKNSQKSVTQRPNFFKQKSHVNKHVLIDMPGNDDNLLIRKLINFHYFKTMSSNIKQVRFLMVITLQKNRDDTYGLHQKQLQMMQSFSLMLPTCRQNICIILNRIDQPTIKHQQIKASFRTALSNCKNNQLKNYYSMIGDSQIYVIQRPTYVVNKQGKQGYTKKHDTINKIMMNIVNDDSKAFKRLQQKDYNIVNIFNNKNNKLNKDNINMIQKLCIGLEQNVKKSKNCLFQLINHTLDHICNQKSLSLEVFQQKISTFLSQSQFQMKPLSSTKDLNQLSSSLYKLDQQRIIPLQKPKIRYEFIISHIIDFFNIFSLKQFQQIQNFPLEKYQQLSMNLLKAIINKFIIIAKQIIPNQQIHNKLMYLYCFIIRRNQQLIFLMKIMSKNNKSIMNHLQTQKQKIDKKLIEIKICFTEYIFYDFKNYLGTVYKYIEIDVQKIIKSRNYQNYHDIKVELKTCFDYISNFMHKIQKDQQKEKKIKNQLQKKKKLIDLLILLYIDPYPKHNSDLTQPQKDQIKRFLKDLLNWDIKNLSQSLQLQIHIVYRIAELFYKLNDLKNSMIMHLALNLNEQTIKILDMIQNTNNLHCQQYLKIAQHFQKNGQFFYAIKVLQKGKKETIKNPSYILKFQNKLQKLTNDKKYQGQMKEKLKKKRENLSTLYQWKQIQKLIQYLKKSYNQKNINMNNMNNLMHMLKGNQ